MRIRSNHWINRQRDMVNGVQSCELDLTVPGWRSALSEFIDYINCPTNFETIDQHNKNEGKELASKVTQDSYQHKTPRNVNLRTRFIVLSRDRFCCCLCGASPSKDPSIQLQVDHVVPWSLGGETIIDNLQTLCQKCNIGKSNTLWKDTV